jgi:hypothetical protein
VIIMANNPKMIVVPGPFFDALERLLNTAPPPKTGKEKADRATAKRIIKRTRKRRVEVLDDKALSRLMQKKAGTRKKAR